MSERLQDEGAHTKAMTGVAPASASGRRANPGLHLALILGFVAFITSFGAHIVAVNLPVYAQTVGVGVAMIGLLIAAYASTTRSKAPATLSVRRLGPRSWRVRSSRPSS